MNKGNFEVKSHYKMYKAGKRWVVAGMATLSLLGGLMMVSGDASADGVDSSVAPVADSQAPAETTNNATTNSVVLSASATPAPASSVSAEVSATSESSVVSSVVVSSSVASSVVTESVSSTSSVSVAVSSDASSVVSQSLASSVVVPADAVTVKDTESEKAYALGTTPDADTAAPDSAVTAVPMNAAYTSSTKAKSASVPAVSTSGTIAASSYIKTDSAQNHTSFSYKGSSQVSDYFKQTGDITGSITNSSYASASVSSAVVVANNAADNQLMTDSKKDDIFWKAIVPQVKNEAGSVSYKSQLDILKGFQLKGGYRVLPIDGKGNILPSSSWGSTGSMSTAYTGGQAIGIVMAPVQPVQMGTPEITHAQDKVNANDGIDGIDNAVIAGRDLYVRNAGDVSSLLVHVRKTDANGNLIGTTNVNGTATAVTTPEDGYAWGTASDGYPVTQGNVLKTTPSSWSGALSTDTTTAIQKILYNGVYFDYVWANPIDNHDGTVTGTLTYREFSDSAMTKLLSEVSTKVTAQRYMAVGLYASNGGNGQSFFGGISYFQGTNATTDVNVSYTFGKNNSKLQDDTKVNAVVGETIIVTDKKTDTNADAGMNVTYVAPDVPGFKIDPSSVMSATAGSGDLAIKYVVNQDDFTDQVTNAKTALQAIDDSIADLQAMIDKDPSSIDVQSVLTKMQDIRKQAVDKIAALQTIADGSVDLTTVADVQDALQKIMQGANDVSALATDASNQIDLAKEITKNSVSINKNISDDNDVMTAKGKINEDIASGQTAEDIANDKVDLENKVGIATQNRKEAISKADEAVASNTINNALVDGAKSALSVLTGESDSKDDSHTKTDIDAGVKNLAKVSEVDVPKSVMNVQDVIDAIAKVTDLLTKDPTNTAAIDQALQGLKDKITQAKQAVASAGSAASAVANAKTPVNVSDQDQTALNQAKQHLQAVVDDADSTTDDIATAQQAVADELKKLTDARDAEIVKGKTVAATTVPDNATDQTDAITQLQKDQDALTTIMNNVDSTLKDIQAAEQKVATDLGEMADVVTKAKTDANKVVTDWNDNSKLYTDQTDALATIQGDIDHLNSVMKNDKATASDITDAQTQLQNDIKKVTDARNGSVANGNNVVTGLTDQQKKDALVADSLDELHTAIAGGTKSAIDTAIDKVKTAVDTMIDADINDVPAVVTAKQKIADLLQGNTVDMDEVAKATSALKQVTQQATADLTTAAAKDGVKVSELQPKLDQLQHDLADMQKNLQTAKNAAQAVADTATPTNVADQAIAGSAYDTAKTALENTLKNDNATASDLAAAQAAVTKALQDMQDNVTTAKQQVTDVANDWAKEADKFTDQDTSAVKQALTDLAELPADATQADYTRVKTALDTAKQAVDAALDANPYDQAKVDTAKNNYDDAIKQAESKLDATKKQATVEEPANLLDQIGKLPKDDQDKLATAVANLKNLTDPKNNATTKVSDIKAQQDIVNGILKALQETRQNAIDTANTTVTATVPTNIADQADKSTLQADKDNLQKVAADDKSTLDDIQKAQQKVEDDIADMTKKVTEAKTAGKQDVATWTDPKNVAKYTDQDTKAIEDDIAALNDLTAADNTAATQKAITDARQKLADDIAIVEQKRQAAVDDGNKEIDKAQPNVNLDDEVKLTVDGLKQAIADGTQMKIEEAIKKVQTAVDTMVATNVSDSDAVNTAKQAVNDALNATDLNTDTLNKALGDLDKAVSGAKDALATAKGKATVAEPANLDDQIKKLSPADQDKLATAVANLKNLTDPKNDGTTKASDIKAQQDIVDGILKPLQKNREEAVTEANGIATADVPTNITDQADAAGATLKDDKAALQTAAADDSKTLADIKKAQQKVTDDITAMTKNVTDAKNAGNKVVTTWSDDANVAKYVDQDTTTVDADIKRLQELTSSDETTQTAIDDARKQLESDIKTVTQARQTVINAADKVVATVNNGGNVANQDVKNRIQAVKDAESAKGTAAIDEAVSKLQNANDTVVPANVADVDGVTTAKQAVDDALNATSYDPATAAQKVADYKKAVATAKDALKQVTDAVAAIKVPANLQDQVAMDKKNKLGDLTQQVSDLQNLATQADTTASALQANLTDMQNRLADMTKKLHDMQADGAKLVDQFANATDDNVVKARKQLSTLLASDDATMTDIQNAMNVLKATSAPANNKPVEKQEVPVTNGQVSVPVANGDGAFVIVTDANGKQKVVQLDTADGKASANVSGAKNAQVVTVPKHGDKPFIFVTDGSGTAQYTELTPDGAKTTITPDGSKTETSTGSTIDVPAGSDVSVIYLPTADISVQAGAKNIDVPVKTGYTATVTDANGNVVQMADGSTINVEGVPAGTNYLVTYTPDPAKVVVKLGTKSGFKQGEAPAAGNKNAQKLTTVADALAKLQQDEKAAAAIVSTGYTDTKVNVTNALTEMNKVDENLDIDGYAHRVVAPDGKEYASLEDAVKANPTFAAGTTQMKVIYAPLDGQKIQVKDVSGKVLGTVTGKSDAEINVNDFAPIDAVLKQTAKKDNLKITVTAPDGTTYDSLSAALAATGYFDHVGLQNGASSFDAENAQMMPILDDQGNVTGYYAVLAEAASLNDMNIQDFVVSYTPAIDDTAVSVDGNHYYNNTSNKEMSDNDVDNTVNNLHNMLENGAKSGVANAINKVKTAVNQSVAINVADSGDVQKAKQVINDILNGDNVDTGKLKQAISNLATAVAQAKQALADTKASADADGKNWQTVSPKYADQNTSAIQNDLKKLHDLTSADNTTATKTDIEQARKQLQDDIKKVDDVRQASVKTADGAVATVKNGTNDDVKNRIAAVKAAEETGTKSVIDEAVAKLQTADATVVPTNVSDDAAVIAAKRAVDDALNAKTYVPGDVAKAEQAYDQAVADAQATLRTVIDQANAIKVPANLQNNAGDLIQMVTDLQGMANRADTTVSALRTALTAVQNRLAELNAMNQGGVIDGRQGESIVNTNVATPKEPGVAMAERHESRAAATVVKANKTSVAKGAVMAKPVQAVATTTTAKQAATRGNKTVVALKNGASVAKADKQVVATTTNTPKTDADRIHDMLDDAKVNKASINMTENASENYIGIIIASLMVAGMFGLLAAFWRRQKESEKEFQARINGDK